MIKNEIKAKKLRRYEKSNRFLKMLNQSLLGELKDKEERLDNVDEVNETLINRVEESNNIIEQLRQKKDETDESPC